MSGISKGAAESGNVQEHPNTSKVSRQSLTHSRNFVLQRRRVACKRILPQKHQIASTIRKGQAFSTTSARHVGFRALLGRLASFLTECAHEERLYHGRFWTPLRLSKVGLFASFPRKYRTKGLKCLKFRNPLLLFSRKYTENGFSNFWGKVGVRNWRLCLLLLKLPDVVARKCLVQLEGI